MTNIDDDVRSLLATAAETIRPEGVPPLRLPQAVAGDQQRPVMHRWQRFLGPAAAAASVAVIAAAALVISNSVAGRPPPSSRGDASVPPYYIAISLPSRPKTPYDAAIYATRTGARVARIVPTRRPHTVIGFTLAANDRTFAIALVLPPAKTWFMDRSPKQIYLGTFNPVTRTVKIAPIPKLLLPRNAILRSMALSPSGAKLAVDYFPLVPRTNVLKVINLATGTVRTWASSSGQVVIANDSTDLSWANDNRTLGFNWYGFNPTTGRVLRTSGFWLLDTAKPGGDLIADSRRVLRYGVGSPFIRIKDGYFVAPAMLAPDGRTIVAAVASRQSENAGYLWFATYNAANGRLEHKFDRTSLSRTPLDVQLRVLWTSPFARSLVAAGLPGQHDQTDLVRQSGRVTVLPRGQQQDLLPGPLPDPAW